MVGCEQGYLCDVCGEEVESIRDSDLYLRYVTGQIDARALLTAQERHLMCNPVVAQFIDVPVFRDISVDGPMSRQGLDPDFVSSRTHLMTRGWHRLQELAKLAQSVPIAEYPLPEFRGGG